MTQSVIANSDDGTTINVTREEVTEILVTLAATQRQLTELKARFERLLGGNSETPKLTATEVKLLEYVKAGFTNSQIAAARDVSESTVKAQFYQLFLKFNVESRGQLLAVANKFNLV